MFPIPWYVAVFESVPEGFLIIYLSLKIIDKREVGYSKMIAIAVIYGLITYFVRNITFHIYNISIPPYLHTILLIIALAVLMKYILGIDFQSCIISIFTVSVIFGLAQYILVLSLMELFQVDSNIFNDFQWLNIILFIPVAAITFCVVNLYSNNEGSVRMDKGSLIALFAVAFQLMTVLMLNQILFVSNIEIYYRNLPVIVIALSAIALIFYLSLKYIQTYSKKEIELELLKYHLKDVEEFIKTLRAERHENMKNVQTIQALAFLGKYEELKNF